MSWASPDFAFLHPPSSCLRIHKGSSLAPTCSDPNRIQPNALGTASYPEASSIETNSLRKIINIKRLIESQKCKLYI